MHKPELGIIYQIRSSYIEGYIDKEAFRGWHDWHLKEVDFDLYEFVKFIKNSGRCCLICMEEYAKPKKTQKYFCHRDFLTDIILNNDSEDFLLRFSKRKDL